MKYNIKRLVGYTLSATDGEIGKVKEFYFDDETWTIRYLIIETGNWLSGRKVLISPEALLKPDHQNKAFPINLTKEQIKNSPDLDTEKPVSRQQELKLYEHYPWGTYWGRGLWGRGMGTTGMMMPGSLPLEEAIYNESNTAGEQTNDNPHLRSTDNVTGYNIRATDGEIGDVEDFIIDDNTWKLHFLLVDTGNWFPGKKVLISPNWIKEIEWSSSAIVVSASAQHIKNSPEYQPGQEVSESYEANLQNYYGRFISH